MIKLLERITVKKRIVSIVMLSIFCMFGSLVIDYIQANSVRNSVDNMYRHPVTVSRTISNIELNIVLIHREMKDIALGKDLRTAQGVVHSLHNETLDNFRVLEDRFLGDQTQIKELEQLFIDWKPIQQKIINYRSLNRPDLAYEINITEAANHIEKLTRIVSGIRQFADNKLEDFYSDTKRAALNSVIISSILAVVAIILFLVASYLVIDSINAQLRKLSRFSNQLSKGDLLATLRVEGESEIDQLGREMLIMRDNLKELIYKNETSNKQLIESEKLATLGGLVAGVAHEVNTPLGISVTATSVITEIRNELKQAFHNQTLTTEQFAGLMEKLTISSDMLDENLNRATRLIHDFKLTAVDQISDNRCSFNLKEILKALLSSMYPETRKVPVVPQLSGGDEIMMNSLPGAVTQVISNLVMNSVRHAFYDQPEAEIHISFRTSGHNIILEYRDNGCGVHTSLHEKIFEPFYTSLRGTRANGMGLALVSSIVKQRLGGELSFTSAPSQGVHFVFTLPIELPDQDEAEALDRPR